MTAHLTRSLWRKIILVFLTLLLFFSLSEAGLRLSGWGRNALQESVNLQSLKQKNVYRIFCIGESSTQGQYPLFLGQALNARNIGVHFSVIDEGEAATNSVLILNRMESYLEKYRPDMVVAMMGINDQLVTYYQSISEPETWVARHSQLYRFVRMRFRHLLEQIKRENLYGISERAIVPGGYHEAIESGRFFLEHDQFQQAEASFKKAIALDPKNDEAYSWLGQCYQMQCKFRQAENVIRKLIHINPNSYGPYVRLGLLYQMQGEFAKAEDCFKKAIEINPENDNAYVELGGFYLDLHKFPQTKDSFEKAIQINPKNENAYWGLGRTCRIQGNAVQAEDSFKKAIEMGPHNDNAYLELGGLYLDQHKLWLTEELFKQAVEHNPRSVAAYFRLGMFYRDQGNLPQAEDAFRKAVELDPENEVPLGALASLYAEMGKTDLAQEYFKRANRIRLAGMDAVTVKNYRKLKDLLDRKGIRLVCVQYPMRNVQPLKRIFAKDKDVIVVDNEELFKKAVHRSGYKEYFRDMYAGDFGHCTQKGNELLAQNIANNILRDVFNK